ncbi:disulfide bond formation protein B [Pelagibius sp.]|uniref:disulfide bond formation protein B n=1 Tax=Pelagibius sp. TaxID=1931238 RepID=UPI003B506F89
MTTLGAPQSETPWLWPALLAAACLGALGTAFASQYWGGLYPCPLCVYQRYAYGAALAVALGALAVAGRPAWRRGALLAAGLAFLGGAGLAGFHVGVEQQWWEGLAACAGPSLPDNASIEEMRALLLNQPFAPCDAVPWSLFGISIAGYNLIASVILAALAVRAGLHSGRLARDEDRSERFAR